jgi:predicted phosphoadenosine phosphosulfate sulfurtransferase
MDYLDDIDITQFKEIPTYKRMCICIIKNDHLCKYMGFSLTKDEMNRRKAIQEKYKDL